MLVPTCFVRTRRSVLPKLIQRSFDTFRTFAVGMTPSDWAVPAPPVPTVPVAGTGRSFPVHRIYCVARNYADHVREMGQDPDREDPCFFTKPPDAVVHCGTLANRNHNNNFTSAAHNVPDVVEIPYPLATSNLHYEIELAVAIGTSGTAIAVEDALAHVFGYAVAVDLTRRDLQQIAKNRGRPWDSAKGFDQSAPISSIIPVTTMVPDADASIWLTVNHKAAQSGQLSQMIWSVPEIVSHLSKEFTLLPGDLILTGTPAGVGPIVPGDTVRGGIEGLAELAFRIR